MNGAEAGDLLDYDDAQVEDQQPEQGVQQQGNVGLSSTGFKDLNLKPPLLRAIQDCGFEHPSEGEGQISGRLAVFQLCSCCPGSLPITECALLLSSLVLRQHDCCSSVDTTGDIIRSLHSSPPRPAVQHQCLPHTVLGMDVLCQAKSGMGKTAVFVLTLLQSLEPGVDENGVPKVAAIVMCHTRELAYQVSHHLQEPWLWC